MLIAVSTTLSSPPIEKQKSSVESMEFPAKKFTKKTKFLKKTLDKLRSLCYNKDTKKEQHNKGDTRYEVQSLQ